jgi:predicted RNA-binding protein with TRAM domain
VIGVKLGSVLQIKITGKSENYGIGGYEGYVIFVPEAQVGDIVQARIIEIKKTIAYAENLGVIEEGQAGYDEEEGAEDDDYGYPGFEFGNGGGDQGQ